MKIPFLLILAVQKIISISGFSFQQTRVGNSNILNNRRSFLLLSAEEYERPTVQVKRLVESLSNGDKSGSEVEAELKEIETESKLLEISTALGGSIIGLVTGGLLDGYLTNGDAPWAGPVGFAVLGPASYYGVIQKQRGDISELLVSVIGKPVLRLSTSTLKIIKNKYENLKKSTQKTVNNKIEEIYQIPVTIRGKIIAYKDDTIVSIKAIPVSIQKSVEKSYENTKLSAVKVFNKKVSELKSIPVRIQEKIQIALEKTKNNLINKKYVIINDIKEYPKSLYSKIQNKTNELMSDITKIPQKIINNVNSFFTSIKNEITDSVDRNVKNVKNSVDSILPSDTKE